MESKYLKYKQKYLNLLSDNKQKGGSSIIKIPIILSPKKVIKINNLYNLTSQNTTPVSELEIINYTDSIDEENNRLYQNRGNLQFKMILNLYEYLITGYNKDIKYKFNPLIKSKDRNCSSIAVQGFSGIDSKLDTKMSSCDLLDSNPNVVDEDVVQKILQSNELLKRFKLIYEELPSRITLDEIPDNLLLEMKKSCNTMTEICDKIIKKYNEQYNTFIPRMKYNSYILHLEHNPTDRIVVLGDIHGSFHTFLRILIRLHLMNILNLTTMKINNGYKLLFLGDVVDRGSFCLEVVIIILIFILNNNDNLLDPKVIYNRGNHEEIDTNTRDGLFDELTKKCNPDGQTIHEKVNELFKYFSSAVLLKYINGNIWFCHGGIPTTNLNLDLTPTIDNITILPDVDLQKEIRWNDFGTNLKTEPNTVRRTANIVGIEDLTKFLTKNNIKLICRGHQDNNFNSYILGNEPITDKIELSQKNLNNPNIFIDNNNYITDEKRYKETKPIRRIILEHIKSNNIVKYNGNDVGINPVITISTNTDIKRDLNKDSFVIFGLDTL